MIPFPRAPLVTAALWLLALLSAPGAAQEVTRPDADWLREHYRKTEVLVPMRDGTRLHTVIYAPRDTTRRYPILLLRTPYSAGPYGEEYRVPLGPSGHFPRAGYVFVVQDVRGRFLSEGTFADVRPHLANKRSPAMVDESSDTYDTIEWLLANVTGHNGRVGQWGISYPGFYTAAGAIDAHPALRAISPQAPIGDWWYDDFRHWGAFFLSHAFNFFAFFGVPRPEPTAEYTRIFPGHGTPDGYAFFLELGALGNVNARHFQHRIAFWDSMVAHPNYDGFWQARNLLPHLRRIAPAVLTVGGWFDAEDLYGTLNTYRAIEQQEPAGFNALVMGPWAHGGWGRSDGEVLGNIRFDAKTSWFYRDSIEFPFFEHFLRDAGALELPEAFMFATGANRWHRFDAWPPADVTSRWLYLLPDGRLGTAPPGPDAGHDEFTSDPARPVPFTEDIAIGMTQAYMTDDQRFAARRPDVLVYRGEALSAPLTVAGPVAVELWVSTSAEDADWVVKLIDVFPDSAPDPPGLSPGVHMGGYQMMVRSEVIRGRFRDDPARPRRFVPDQPTSVRFQLQDVLHTFRPGHRIMVQVQSTWFPLVDRNPQKWVDNIFVAREQDYTEATHRLYHDAAQASRIRIGILPE